MHVTILVPDIHDFQTGGNVYNRRMVEELRPETPVQVVPWGPETEGIPDLSPPEPGVIVVDSLLARRPAIIQALRRACPETPLILLVHYLCCIDPTKDDLDAAAAERAALEAIDGAVTTSRSSRQALVKERLSEERVKVAPPGLGERYRRSPPTRLGGTVPRMLTVANLLPEKGLKAFVAVLRNLRSLPWTWVLAGEASLDPDYAEEVIGRIRATGLSERMTHVGTVPPDTLRTWYDRADLFVLPSRFETRSLSMREAMARGLPVVGYRVGGVEENFGEASAGHLVPSGNEEALRAALRHLLADPMARGQKGRAAWRRSRAFQTWRTAAGRFRGALEALHAQATTETG